MSRKPIIILLVTILALVSMACGITINLPVDRVVTGPSVTEDILVEAPDVDEVKLTLDFGAGSLEIQPASDGALVSGQATYNAPDLKPRIEVENENVRISTGDLNIDGIPSFKDNLENRWELELGSQPMHLEINAGAYNGNLDLGGLALKSLDVTDGAANVHLRFDAPNLVEMDSLRYQTGASNVQLSGLANANFTSMVFRSGAGDYRLDFSGELQRDAVVTIESGFSQVVIVVPEGTSAKLITTGGLLNVDASSAWKRDGQFYILGSGGPVLTINVDLGAGNLELLTK